MPSHFRIERELGKANVQSRSIVPTMRNYEREETGNLTVAISYEK